MPLRLRPSRDRKLYRMFFDGEALKLLRGRILYRYGDRAEDVYIVEEGHIRLTLALPAGNDVTVEVAGPLEMFGDEAFQPGERRLYGATAGAACRVLRLPGADVLRAIRSSRRTYASFLRSRREDLQRARFTAVAGFHFRTRARIAEVILRLGERFGEERGRAVLLPIALTHRDLADLAGAHRSTVTTTLNEWIYEDLLKETSEGLLIVRPAELRSLASARRSEGRRR